MLLDIVWKYPKERLKNHMRIKAVVEKKIKKVKDFQAQSVKANKKINRKETKWDNSLKIS